MDTGRMIAGAGIALQLIEAQSHRPSEIAVKPSPLLLHTVAPHSEAPDLPMAHGRHLDGGVTPADFPASRCRLQYTTATSGRLSMAEWPYGTSV